MPPLDDRVDRHCPPLSPSVPPGAQPRPAEVDCAESSAGLQMKCLGLGLTEKRVEPGSKCGLMHSSILRGLDREKVHQSEHTLVVQSMACGELAIKRRKGELPVDAWSMCRTASQRASKKSRRGVCLHLRATCPTTSFLLATEDATAGQEGLDRGSRTRKGERLNSTPPAKYK